MLHERSRAVLVLRGCGRARWAPLSRSAAGAPSSLTPRPGRSHFAPTSARSVTKK
jgi:hypothetical protein